MVLPQALQYMAIPLLRIRQLWEKSSRMGCWPSAFG
jgi:hypothetical protein